MNVLSLFDGMSCGQIALNRAGIKYENYFASEIDKYAMQITLKNYPNTIQLGDVTKWESWNLPKIDLLIGGSPCQGFSFAGKQLNFADPRSRLFMEFVEVLKHYKPKFFLLENVKMKKEFQDIISQFLEVEPIEINSALVSAQNRKRLYWTNIPSVCQPKDKGILLKDVIDKDNKQLLKECVNPTFKTNYVQYDIHGKGHGSQDQRCYYLSGKHGALTHSGGASKVKVYMGDNKYRVLTQKEVERLQTVPDYYTDGVSFGKSCELLGNGWTVDVIAHISRLLKYRV